MVDIRECMFDNGYSLRPEGVQCGIGNRIINEKVRFNENEYI